MKPAVAALGAAFILGTLAFVAVAVHVALTGDLQATDIVIMGAACLLACATVMLTIRRRPRIDGISTHGEVYERALKQVSADH